MNWYAKMADIDHNLIKIGFGINYEKPVSTI